ncbi:hypothetical protein FsymDg_0295 [Candidatus Protofrankia datiscae]|uniref:Uncharacterized protein n=1 Tax=Candidatus Protofrankia datiscae TaxID=2716812 RepID=F8B3M9_9ACTN|nr:hypothetical protein FsymDg_0295 [Candidatus Protofrankia datiscae]
MPHTHGQEEPAGQGRPTGPVGAGPMAAAVLRVLVVAAGLAAIGYGIHGLVDGRPATNPPNAAAWLIGGIALHDLLVVPATMAAGFVLGRLVPAPYRAVAQGASVVSAAVALASLPLWRGYGGSADNPSVNPLPYGRNLGIVLGLIWACAAVVIICRALHARFSSR